MTSIHVSSTPSIQLPKTLRKLAEAAIATAAIALIANVGSARAITEQAPQSQVSSEASALQTDGPLRQGAGRGPIAPLDGDIDPSEATRRRVAAAVNSAELDIRAADGVESGSSSGLQPTMRLVEVEL